MPSEPSQHRAGLACAVLAHVMWGLFPLFWRLLRDLDPLAVASHRVLWAWLILVTCLPLLLRATRPTVRQQIFAGFSNWQMWTTHGLAAILIFSNWLVFIWAVGHGRVLEASLGYYINPLLNVLLGVLVLREKLLPAQWLAVSVAAAGVSVITVAGGGLPWISIVLAVSFALYSLVKKKATLPALWGLLLETTVLLTPALLLLTLREPAQLSGPLTTVTWLLLMLGGLITIMPLALFAFAARRVPLATLGILQYIGPTLQFVIGAWILSEPFGVSRLVGFCFVWTGLIIYLVGSKPARRPATMSAHRELADAVD